MGSSVWTPASFACMRGGREGDLPTPQPKIASYQFRRCSTSHPDLFLCARMYVLLTTRRLPGVLRRNSAWCSVFVPVDDKAAETEHEMEDCLSKEYPSVLKVIQEARQTQLQPQQPISSLRPEDRVYVREIGSMSGRSSLRHGDRVYVTEIESTSQRSSLRPGDRVQRTPQQFSRQKKRKKKENEIKSNCTTQFQPSF